MPSEQTTEKRITKSKEPNNKSPKQGCGQNNRLVIPGACRDGLIYYERLLNPVAVEGQIGTQKLTILIEPTKPDYRHACAPDDIFKLLSLIPEHPRCRKLHETPKPFVFRQIQLQ